MRMWIVLLFVVGCKDPETPLCDELGSLCHDVGEAGDADAEECHDLGHAGDEEACEAEYDACVAICEAAGDSGT